MRIHVVQRLIYVSRMNGRHRRMWVGANSYESARVLDSLVRFPLISSGCAALALRGWEGETTSGTPLRRGHAVRIPLSSSEFH